MKLLYPDLVEEFSQHYTIPKDLIWAMMQVESSQDTWKCRYESKNMRTNDPDKWAHKLFITAGTESTLQNFSFGLLSLLGVTARDMGFNDYLPKLFIPRVGLEWGLKYLQGLLAKYGNEQDAISAYNMGTPKKNVTLYINQKYVDSVNANRAKIRNMGVL